MLTAAVDFHLEPGGRQDDTVQAFILTSLALSL